MSNFMGLKGAALIALVAQVSAFWRMECHSPIGLARIDPLVEPGLVADHAHTIHGGKNFGLTTDTDQLMASDCTSCRVLEDNSVYWTPSLHFIFKNGSSTIVPQVGGMLAYYLLYGENLEAFPKDFRMLAGDTRQRNFTWPEPDPPKPWSGDQAGQFALSQKAVGFNCLDYSATTPEATLYRHRMPEKEYLDAHCKNGIRMELMFPSCWNGKDLDSDNHKSHMAYPSMTIDGTCPEGFDHRVPSLLYETIWNTYAFKDLEGEFALSNGDTTGCGYHGDFMTGWDEKFLQTAVNTCTNPSGKIEDCSVFTLQTEQEAAKCTMDMPKMLDDDDCKGPRKGLPGNVAIQAGPEYATKNSGNKPTSLYIPPASNTKAPVPSFHQATTALTDNYGGGISVANHQVSDIPEPSAMVTPSPAIPSVDTPGKKVLSTSTYTSAGAVYEVVYEEVDITVTATEAAPTVHKHKARHNHHHRNGHF